MGIEIDFDALSGIWSGQYWLGEADPYGVHFSAWVSVENGRLTGSILEPSFFGLGERTENEANIRGHVSEEEFVFLKTYKDTDHEPAYYEGELSECGQKILGRWYFGWPDETTGRFAMSLKSATKDKTPNLQKSARSLR